MINTYILITLINAITCIYVHMSLDNLDKDTYVQIYICLEIKQT